MEDQPVRLSLRDLPLELRLRIYEHVFAGAVALIELYGDYSDGRSFGKIQGACILQVSKKLREEAFPVLKSQLTVILHGFSYTPALAKTVFPYVEMVSFSCVRWPTDEESYIKSLVPYLANVGTTVYQVDPFYVRSWWEKALECSTEDDIFSILRGDRDELIVEEFKTRIQDMDDKNTTSDACFTHENAKAGRHCKTIFEFSGKHINWGNSDHEHGDDLEFAFGFDIDAESHQLTSRWICYESVPSFHDEVSILLPAEGILFLREGLDYPTLYRPDTGQTRPILGPAFFGVGREARIAAIEEQLANKAVLQRAITAAKRCTPIQTADVVGDAERALASRTKSLKNWGRVQM